MSLKQFGTYAVVIAIALAGGITLSACGGGEEAKRSERATTSRASGDGAVTTSTTTPAPRDEQPPARRQSRSKAPAIGKVLANKHAKRKPLPPTIKGLIRQLRREHVPKSKLRAELYARLPAKYRVRVLRYFTPIILKAFDFKGAKVQVLPGGQIVKVMLPKREACKAHPDEAARIRRSLRRSISPKRPLPYPRTVTVAVAGSGQPLAAYLAKSCKRIGLPGARGRIVFRKSGSHILATKRFRIRSKRWTVEYVNGGSFFQVFVRKGKAFQPDPINEFKRGSGKKTFTGRGRFSLYIAGSRDWTVRVRDGA